MERAGRDGLHQSLDAGAVEGFMVAAQRSLRIRRVTALETLDRNIQAVYGKIGTTTIGPPLPCRLLACVYVRVHPVSLDRVSECKTSAPSSGWCFQPPNLGS